MARKLERDAFLARFPHLLILRSFTKFFGIPGIRLGYLLAGPDLIERLAAIQEPWSINTLAQVMGRVCLADRDFMGQTRELVNREREFLLQGLAALPGLALVEQLYVAAMAQGLENLGTQGLYIALKNMNCLK